MMNNLDVISLKQKYIDHGGWYKKQLNLFRCLDECIDSQMDERYDEACVKSCMADTPDDFKMWAHDWWVCYNNLLLLI